MSNPKLVAIWVFTLACFGQANAAGFQSYTDDAISLGVARAGTAVNADNASIMAFNPAGLIKLREREYSIGFAGARSSNSFTDMGSSSGAFTGTPGKDWTGQTSAVSTYLTYAWAPDTRLGLGIYQPFIKEEKYPGLWPGKAQASSFAISSWEVTSSIATKLGENSSLGFSINWQRARIIRERAASTLTAFSLNQDSIKFDGEGSGFGWTLGGIISLSPATELGVSYKSSIHYVMEGSTSVSGPSSALLSPNAGPAHQAFTSPDIFRVSLADKNIDGWILLGDLTATRWSALKDLTVFKNSTGAAQDTSLSTSLRDTFRISFGAIHPLNPTWDLKFGYAYDQSPIKNPITRTVALPEGDQHWLTAGAKWKGTNDLRIDFGVAYVRAITSSIDNDQRSSNRGRLTGNFGGDAWVAGIQISDSF